MTSAPTPPPEVVHCIWHLEEIRKHMCTEIGVDPRTYFECLVSHLAAVALSCADHKAALDRVVGVFSMFGSDPNIKASYDAAVAACLADGVITKPKLTCLEGGKP